MTTSVDFPFEWENPDDAKLFWTRDTVHNTRPALPLMRSFGRDVIGPAIGRVHEVFPFPGRSRSIMINGYSFETNMPDPPDVTQQKLERLQPIIRQHIADLPRRWRDAFEPELARDLAAWRAFDRRGAAFDALAAHLHQAIERAARHWEIHFLVVFPVLESTRPLSQMYARLTGDADEQSPYRLVAGYPSKTTERDIALWQVSELARASAVVADVFATRAPHEALPALRALDDADAQRVVAAFDDYLTQYGDRGAGFFDEPTWQEAPTFVLLALRNILAGERHDPRAALQAVAAERERFVAETLAQIPAAARDEFTHVLRAAQAVYPLRETHAFYIDQASVSQLRYIIIECARRLTQLHVLAQPADVFWLELSELLDALRDPAATHLSERIAQRRADDARWSQLIPPATLGTPPAQRETDSEREKFFRLVDTNVPSGLITQIKGAAGSRGLGRGPARVVRDASEFPRVQPGDILVCPTTFPPWTPLFRAIAGLVTDGGGVLSHAAIVAREYKLPAVVGTGYATRVIRDGQIIEVDGTKGIVTILE